MRVPPPLPRREATKQPEPEETKSTDSEPVTPRISDIRGILEPPAPSEPDTLESPASGVEISESRRDQWTPRTRVLVSFAVALLIVGAIAALAATGARRTQDAQLDGLLRSLPLLPSSLIQSGLRGAPFVVVPMGPPAEEAGRLVNERVPLGRGPHGGQTRRPAVSPAEARRPEPPSDAPNESASAGAGRYQPDAP